MKNKAYPADSCSSIKAPSVDSLLGMSVQRFLAEFWHKKPLLIRAAIPGFAGLLSPDELAGMACEDDIQSRLVSYSHDQWHLENGPFDEARFAELDSGNWTLLVQSVNHFLPEAADLLQRFDFIPHARLDDLMVSYAPHGGGVGPHLDSYDVFLLQGHGQRLWRISHQQDPQLLRDAPLRIIEDFQTEQEWLLEPGDMLYLPPQVAHWGIAVGDCMTYSIGFRAPTAQELGAEFLQYMQEKLVLEGRYADPDLRRQLHPAEIGPAMVTQVATMLKDIRWSDADVADFLGCYLSEPKPSIVFAPPKKVSLQIFSQRLQKHGLSLGLSSQLLFHGQNFFINGERIIVPAESVSTLQLLADDKSLPPGKYDEQLGTLLHDWFKHGYVQLGEIP